MEDCTNLSDPAAPEQGRLPPMTPEYMMRMTGDAKRLLGRILFNADGEYTDILDAALSAFPDKQFASYILRFFRYDPVTNQIIRKHMFTRILKHLYDERQRELYLAFRRLIMDIYIIYRIDDGILVEDGVFDVRKRKKESARDNPADPGERQQ